MCAQGEERQIIFESACVRGEGRQMIFDSAYARGGEERPTSTQAWSDDVAIMSGFAASLWCELMYLRKPSGAKHSAEFLP